MLENLNELADYVRGTIPQPAAITYLRPLPDAGAVSFAWKEREFVVRRSLQALEIKQERLLITGASMLIQMALVKRNKNEKILGAVMETLRQAEEMIPDPLSRENGLALVETVKLILKKLVTKPTSSAHSNGKNAARVRTTELAGIAA